MTFAALPQHMAVSLRLTVPNTHKYSGGYASKMGSGGRASMGIICICRKAKGFPLCAAAKPPNTRSLTQVVLSSSPYFDSTSTVS
jgi:hypothetical protein